QLCYFINNTMFGSKIEIISNDKVLPSIEHYSSIYYVSEPGEAFRIKYCFPSNISEGRYVLKLKIDGKLLSSAWSGYSKNKYILCDTILINNDGQKYFAK